MTDDVLNLFEISGLDALRCPYYLLEVTNLPNDDQLTDRVRRLAAAVATASRRPFYAYTDGVKHYLASTDAPSSLALPAEWSSGSETAILNPRQDCHELDYGRLDAEQAGLALDILDARIRATLSGDPRLWRDSVNAFNEKAPAAGASREGVGTHLRFGFRLHLLDGRVYLSVSPTLRYMSRESLEQRLAASGSWEELKEAGYVYKFGHRWYEARFPEPVGNSIAEQTFPHGPSGTRHTVYDYTLRSCPEPRPDYIRQLDPRSPAIRYSSVLGGQEAFGAAALCFESFTEADEAARGGAAGSGIGQRASMSLLLAGKYFRKVRLGAGHHLSVSGPVGEDGRAVLFRR